MVDLPRKKVGIVACSGEELAEGTVTRLAALKVLEQLRPDDTVTICLPLFLAGGEGDRAFARFYPTIAVDGCELRCAARGTEMYSGKPAAGIVVSELVAEAGLPSPQGTRRLDQAGYQAVDLTSQRIADLVDELLEQKWSRRAGMFIAAEDIPLAAAAPNPEPVEAPCACGSGIPVRRLFIAGQDVILVALPLIFQSLHDQGRLPGDEIGRELVETVKIYNPIPAGSEGDYQAALLQAYAAFCEQLEMAQ